MTYRRWGVLFVCGPISARVDRHHAMIDVAPSPPYSHTATATSRFSFSRTSGKSERLMTVGVVGCDCPFYHQPYHLVRCGAFAAGTYDDTGW